MELSLFAKDIIIYLENSSESMGKNNKNYREVCFSEVAHYSSMLKSPVSLYKDKLKITMEGKIQLMSNQKDGMLR